MFLDPFFYRNKIFFITHILLGPKFYSDFFHDLNFSWPKIFHYSKFFMTWNFSWPNNFHDPKFSGTHNILWTQIFVTQYFLEPVIIELQQFGTHNFLRSKNFRDLNFWNQNFSKSSLFLGPCQTPTQLGTQLNLNWSELELTLFSNVTRRRRRTTTTRTHT